MRTLVSFPTRLAGRGFTVVELILVIVLVGILSAVVIPRFTTRVEFDARGFFDQTLNMVRYAQKVAIAQRRLVWVQASQADGIICLSYIAVNVNCQSDGGAPVWAPGEQAWFVRRVPAGVGFGASPAFAFDALGQPSPNAAVSLSVIQNGATVVGTVRVEAGTGYVH